MPKKIDTQLRARCVRLVREHQQEYPTLTAAVKTLEKRGLVELRPDEADARARRLAPTEAGSEVVARAVPLWREEHARLRAGLAGPDAIGLAQVLARVAEAEDSPT